MMKEKTKTPQRTGSFPFLLLWMGGHIGVWVFGMFVLMLMMRVDFDLNEFLIIMMGAIGTGLLSTLWQKFLVERLMKKVMTGWFALSMAGWILSGVAFWLTINSLLDFFRPAFLQQLVLLPLFLPVALIQWGWLKKRVHNAWLWVLSAGVGAISFTLPLMDSSSFYPYWMPTFLYTLVPYLIIGIAALLYSGISGAAMWHLWSNERESPDMLESRARKSKPSHSLSHLTDDESDDDDLFSEDDLPDSYRMARR